MNQARKRPMHQKVLSMILVLVMLLGLLSVSAFTVTDTTSSDSADSTEFMRIFHLDCGRKYFSVSEIEGIIDQLAANHYTHLQLAFGNDGLRFLLNDMSVTVNGTKYVSDNVTSAIQQGNTNLTSGSFGELSESDMNGIITYANNHGIQIIPMFNAPGHMYTAVNAMTSLGINGRINKVSTLYDGRTSNWAVDPTDATAVEFAEALLQKYVTYFAQKGSTMFNIGADESGLSEKNYASYAAMVNGMNTIVKEAGMTTLAYNDGIYRAAYAESQPKVKFDNDIIICYWTEDGSSSVADFLSKGFKILNNNNDWYYVLGDYLKRAWNSEQWSYKTASSGVQNTPVTKMMGYTGTEQPIGSILCVWCDGPSVDYNGYGYITQDKTTQQCVYDLIKAMADANPAYFTDTVKLPATDTDDQVSVVVTGTKDQTATVDAVSVRSTYQFDAEKVVSYNVTPMVAGQNYTAQGTVTLPVPTGWVQDASRIRAYIIDNGAVKLLSGTLADGKYTFDVPHFSEMGLLQIAENGGSTVSVSVNQGSTSSSYTLSGDNLPNDGTYTTRDGLASYTVTTGTGETVAEKAGTIVSGNTYIIGNGTQYVKLDGTSITSTTNPAEATQWTLTASSDGYYITSGNYYLSYSNGSVIVSTRSSYHTAWKWDASTNAFNNDYDDWWTTTTYYLTYDNGWKVSNNESGVSSQAYTTRALPAEKTVTFTGVQTGTTAVTLGDKTYNITVNEKQTVEIPISIVDYRADGLLFDFQVGGPTYDYGLVHSYNNDGSKSGVNGGTLSGTSYGTRIAGTTLVNSGYVASDGYSGNYYLWGNKWSRSGMVESALGSNGMPVYTNATVVRVAQELAKGNYNSGEMANVTNSNKVIYDTFIASGKVVNSEASKMSDAFSAHKSWDNITNAYDLAWYLLNTLYQADTNTTTVTDANGVSHTVPIYGMAVNAYDSIILTENNGVYSFDAANGKSHYDTNSRTIYEDDSVTAKQFYPIDGLGYDAILGDTTDKTNDSGSNRPEHPNGNYALRGEAQFVYRDDLYFEFSGDDDVYMYINGVLALDLGGAHGICTKRVNLKDVAKQCHLTEGEVATFTFFYMERNSDASNFKIETNMELVKRGISVQKNAYDAGYVNAIMSGTAVETGRSVYYDLVVTNQSNALMNHICFSDTDDRGGTASFGFGVANAAVTAGTTKTDGTVSLGAAGTYEIYVTDANNAEVAGTRRTFSSLSELSAAVAAVELQPGQSLHVRFLTATFAVKESKILNYVNTVRVTAAVGSQQLSDEATNELYSYNANDTSRTYVVDFGLPLQITGIFDSGAEKNIGNVKLNDSNTLKYGTVVLTSDGYNSSLVYTRTDDKAINDAETIVLDVTYKMGSSNITLQKTLTIIPATSVYYEDSFAQFTDGTGKASAAKWTTDTDGTAAKATTMQALTELGKMSADDVYGHDAAYADSTKLSMGSAHKVTVNANMVKDWTDGSAWPFATFTFKGTGFDVISLTDNKSGAIFVDVYEGKEATGTPVKQLTVNNYYGYNQDGNGKWVVGTDSSNALYQIPVMKVSGLDYDEYTAVIRVAYSKFFDTANKNQYSFWLDAIRVYDPMGKDIDTYKQDNEGYPQYIKLRDQLAKENGSVTTNNNLLFIDGADKAAIATYANYGPNNEVYLENGQAITFTVPENDKIASIQIGAKAPNGSAAQMVVTGGNGLNQELSTATEMYYKIGTNDGSFTITNIGTGILSLTNLKITFTDKPGRTIALSVPTAEEQTAAVMSVRALFAAPAEPFQPDRFEASWGHAVRKGDTATLTVKASEDVDSITVDGKTITAYATKTERTGWGWWAKTVTYREFTYQVAAEETTDYPICAVNSAGVSSDPITATLTVRPSVRDWWHGIFDKWF